MKFAFLIYSWFPHGGQQRDLLRLVRECAARGHSVSVYAMDWNGPKPEGIEINRIAATAIGRLAKYRRYTESVRQALAANPVDRVVGFHKMPLLDVYFAADSCFAEKARTQRGPLYRLSPRFRHFSAYENSVFGESSATEILLLTPRQRNEYLRHYPRCAPRLHLLPPGLAEDRRITARDPAIRARQRRQLAISANEKLVLQVGSGFRIKGVDRSLRALAALPEPLAGNWRFLLAGRDRPGPFLRLARRLGIRDRVRILPAQDDVAALYQAADLMLHPAYSEAAGHVLLEAAAAGLPVLTTATCGYAEHIHNAAAGLVCGEPFRQGELNRHLRQMLQQLDQAEQPTWSENGLRYGRNEDLRQLPKAAADFLESPRTKS